MFVHMSPSRLFKIEMPIALFAIVVILALYVVLSQCIIALKVEIAQVEIAVTAYPMRVGVLLMLLEGTIVRKPSVTPITVRHESGGRKRRERECE